MPENETATIRGGDPRDVRVAGPPTRPHNFPAFWRLFGLYGRQTRPVGFDRAYPDLDDAQTTSYRNLDRLSSLSSDRRRRYDIFDEMDSFGLVSGVLDVYAEESTQPDYDKGVRVWVDSKAPHMVEAGTDALRNCQMEDRIFAVVRRMCKYGDAWQRLLYASGKGVLGWRYANQHNITRMDDRFGRLVGFAEQGHKFRKAIYGQGTDISFPWDYIHFRLLGKNEEDGYGTGLCESFFREWRYMTLTEDSMLMYRLRRTPDRNLILVDVGSLEDHEAMRYVNQWRKRMRKYELVDPATPEYKKQYNPLTPLEDVFLPVRADTQSRVEQLPGSGNIGEVYDLDHFRDAFFGAAKVPKAYFGFEGEIDAKATLQQQDIRFARSAKRIQRATIHGIRQLLDIHFTLIGGPSSEEAKKYDPTEKDNEYLVQMSPISYLDEFERLELVQMRYGIVQTMAGLKDDMQLDARVWALYILLNFAKLPEDMVMRLVSQTSPQPVQGQGEAFEGLTSEQREQVLDNAGRSSEGFSQLSEEEKKWIGRVVANSPMVRKCIRSFAELAEMEQAGAKPPTEVEDMLLEQAKQQVDPSVLPVKAADGTDLNDSYGEDDKVKALNEDIQALRDGGDKLAARKQQIVEDEKRSRANMRKAPAPVSAQVDEG